MSSRSAMTLRMVAGESPRMWRRAIAREPTGSAVRTYSAMTATRTSRLRWSRAGGAIRAHSTLRMHGPAGQTPILEQLHEEGVGEQEAGLRELQAAGLLH